MHNKCLESTKLVFILQDTWCKRKMPSHTTYRSHPTYQTTELTGNIPEEWNGQSLPQQQ